MAQVTLCDFCGEKATVLELNIYSELSQKNTVVTIKETAIDLCASCFELVRESHGIGAMPAKLNQTKPNTTKVPSKELAADEMVYVPSAVDIRKGSTGYKQLSEKVSAIRPCTHPFKGFENNRFVCRSAPAGMHGELASFKGCGAVLEENEV
jgi:hypothetical protein